MKATSPLGAMIEEAIEQDLRFIRHRDNVKYLCCFRTQAGTVFAFERVTQGHINFWLPEGELVRAAADAAGLAVKRTIPQPDSLQPDRYGRISSLRSIPELREAPLYKVPVKSVGEALKVLSALR